MMPVSMPVSFSVGMSYAFDYPRANYAGVKKKFEPRRLQVTEVRDLAQSPLERQTFEEEPLLLRGRWLVTGQDLDKREERSFYVSSMQNVRLIREERLSA
jgi:hypothetical protein